MNPHALAEQIKQKARSLGFELAGIAPADPSRFRDYFQQWLATGNAGTMAWLEKRFDERTDPRTYFPAAQSIICVAINYHVPLHPSSGESPGRIARYALGDDYHDFIKTRLHHLADWLGTIEPSAQTRCAVDSAPLMEKELAARAGIGWMGKNTCIIHPSIGSWLLLGEVLTNLPLPIDQPMIDRCGSCRRCIDACPTGAITDPYQLDARKCISYLTIESRDALPAETRSAVGDWLFGCDICQDVCPWNHRAPTCADPDLQPRFPTGTLDAADVLTWDALTYQQRLRHSPIKRVKLPILQRNAAIVLENISHQ